MLGKSVKLAGNMDRNAGTRSWMRRLKHEIRRAQADQRIEHYLEIGRAVTVHVSGDKGVAVLLEIAQLPGDVRERGGTDEAESLIAGQQAVGIDVDQLDLVALRTVEVEDAIARGQGAVAQRL